ncbi:MAG TPA: TetR family transcriptional regulator [Actinoplanes sp.]|jgi:AcrR family transcriptional regulator
MGLRERKKHQTRAALAWAAVRLIVERGYDKVLVEDIAGEAGVSPRTFNNYFSSKAAAVASRHLDRSLRMADGLRARPAGEGLWTAITEAVVAEMTPGPEVTSQPRPDRETWGAGLQQMMAIPAIQAETLRAAAVAEQELAKAVGERVGIDPADDIYPGLVAATVTAACNVASQRYAAARFTGQDDLETSIRELLVDALSQVAAGLPPPGAK